MSKAKVIKLKEPLEKQEQLAAQSQPVQDQELDNQEQTIQEATEIDQQYYNEQQDEQQDQNEFYDAYGSFDNDQQQDNYGGPLEEDLSNLQNDEFLPLPSDYIIRQQQIATYQMLSQFLTHQDKNITDVLNDVRVSIDCLTKSVLQLNKNLEKHFLNISNQPTKK